MNGDVPYRWIGTYIYGNWLCSVVVLVKGVDAKKSCQSGRNGLKYCYSPALLQGIRHREREGSCGKFGVAVCTTDRVSYRQELRCASSPKASVIRHSDQECLGHIILELCRERASAVCGYSVQYGVIRRNAESLRLCVV